jgi:hypothetical protein
MGNTTARVSRSVGSWFKCAAHRRRTPAAERLVGPRPPRAGDLLGTRAVGVDEGTGRRLEVSVAGKVGAEGGEREVAGRDRGLLRQCAGASGRRLRRGCARTGTRRPGCSRPGACAMRGRRVHGRATIVLGAVVRIRGRGQAEGGADGEVEFAGSVQDTGVLVLEMPPPATRSSPASARYVRARGGASAPAAPPTLIVAQVMSRVAVAHESSSEHGRERSE